MQGSRIITALDFVKAADALALADSIDPDLSRVKVGKELFTRAGPSVVEALQSRGFDVFLDLKFHDIPNTVAGAVSAACDLGVWMVNVHASGGVRMMEAAVRAREKTATDTLLIGVTVLTSMTDDDVASIGVNTTAAEHVLTLAQLTQQAGFDGVVCSAHEVPAIQRATNSTSTAMSTTTSNTEKHFVTVTPGVRPQSLGSNDDQRRTMTPREALDNGSDYLVIGRPITQASQPNQTLTSIYNDLRDS